MFNDFYGALIIIAIAGAVLFNLFFRKKDGKDWVYAVFFIVMVFAGTALFSFALVFNKDADTSFSPFYLVLKAFASAIKAFLGDFNTSITSKLAKENRLYYIAVIAHYLTAVFFTFFIAIKYFGKDLINGIRVFLISRFEKYIIIGCDGQAGIFLRNLTPKQKQKTTIIIQSAQINKKKELLDKGYAVVTVKEIKGGIKDAEDAFSDALKKAGAMRCGFKTRIVSMDEKDEINILIAKIMTDYITSEIKPVKKDGRIVLTKEQEEKTSKIKLDACIMYSFLERAEHFSHMENALGKIRFFNPYEIRARKFLWENPITKLIPTQWIDVEKAKLKNKYNISNIFVGFGSVNKALLKKSIINNQLLNIDYNALVICKDAKKQEKQFMNSAAGLFDKTENGKIKRGAELLPNPDGKVYLDNPPEQNRIVFEEADVLSMELYDRIIKEINGKAVPPGDYTTVIISLGESRISIETALELRQKLYEYDLITGKTEGKDYQRVRIFVKIDDETIFADEKLLNSAAKDINCKIETFGSDEEILSEEYIIDEKLDTLAKNISNRYEGSIETSTAASEWNTCTQFHRESNRYNAMAIRVKLNLLGLDLAYGGKPEQDYTGVFQTRYGTSAAVKLRAERKKLEEEIKLARKNQTGITIPDTVKDEIIDLIERDKGDFADNARNNLAMLEHQRWNTFHLANDWTKLPVKKIGAGRSGRQNAAAKQHACITTFRGLIDLRERQKNFEKEEILKKKEKQYIEAESLLNADTIRHDFNTMDFLEGILAGSGYYICEFKKIEL
jgi:hypothetical protein